MNQYKVFKFGGASLADADAIRNVGNIIGRHKMSQLVVVVSATGKTTNALEEVVGLYFTDKGQAIERLDEIKTDHVQMAEELLTDQASDTVILIDKTIGKVSSFIATSTSEIYDLVYDQIVSAGELLSSIIVEAYLSSLQMSTKWVSALDLIRTDSTYREGRVDWTVTSQHIVDQVKPSLDNGQLVITQGFLGSTESGFVTTLGREGSDYTAAVISYCLDAASQTIWKDVPGILTGDPRLFDHVTKLDYLSYQEAIEMTYYGAKVIHPKTIKPLQNKSIPLYVKSFIHPDQPGTIISDESQSNYPPIVVVEKEQLLVHITSRDFSFIAEHHLAEIFQVFSKYRFKVNIMRNTAISFSACLTMRRNLEEMVEELRNTYNVRVDPDLELITIRHYTPQMISEMTKEKVVLMEEKITKTIQLVVQNTPMMTLKETI